MWLAFAIDSSRFLLAVAMNSALPSAPSAVDLNLIPHVDVDVFAIALVIVIVFVIAFARSLATLSSPFLWIRKYTLARCCGEV
jgi:hypothetical protein